jgi:predicted AAA+ superfamily ATPase
MCASRAGQLLNLSALALDCGLTHNTVKAWLSVLESSGIIYLLRPYHENFGKRLVKSPKLYFLDSGLLCRLLGIRETEQLFLHPNRGSIFEGFVVSEIIKQRLNQGLDPDIYFWRDNVGTEIDLIFQEGQNRCAIEIKSGKTLSPDMTKGLEAWMRYSGSGVETCELVYAGELPLSVKGIKVFPWNTLSLLPITARK